MQLRDPHGMAFRAAALEVEHITRSPSSRPLAGNCVPAAPSMTSSRSASNRSLASRTVMALRIDLAAQPFPQPG